MARPVAIIYNLDGIDLHLRPDTLAKIFSGEITTWNAPDITTDNPGVTLPPTPINPVYRSDQTLVNTTFTGYLADTSPQHWNLGADKAWKSQAGIGAERSDGMTSAVTSTHGAIGYVEWPYASGLSIAKLGHPDRDQFTELSAGTATKAVEQFKIDGTGGNITLKVDYKLTDPGHLPTRHGQLRDRLCTASPSRCAPDTEVIPPLHHQPRHSKRATQPRLRTTARNTAPHGRNQNRQARLTTDCVPFGPHAFRSPHDILCQLDDLAHHDAAVFVAASAPTPAWR